MKGPQVPSACCPDIYKISTTPFASSTRTSSWGPSCPHVFPAHNKSLSPAKKFSRPEATALYPARTPFVVPSFSFEQAGRRPYLACRSKHVRSRKTTLQF